MKSLVLFTDLDGTLLDGVTWSARPAVPALDALLRRGAAVVPVSSRTASEVRLWMRRLLIRGPFISENGCAVTIPKGYFEGPIEDGIVCGDEVRIRLGESVDVTRKHLAAMAVELHLAVRDFSSMTAEEVGAMSGLMGDEIAPSMDREHDDLFLLEGEGGAEPVLQAAAEAHGCRLRRVGRFYHLWRGCSKGEAVRFLTGLYRRLDPETLTAAIGDSVNDLPMLQAADLAYLVRRPDGSFDDLPEGPIRRVEGAGPQGWRMAVEDLIALWQSGDAAREGSAGRDAAHGPG